MLESEMTLTLVGAMRDNIPSYLGIFFTHLSLLGSVAFLTLVSLIIYFFVNRTLALDILRLLLLVSLLTMVLQWSIKLSPPPSPQHLVSMSLYSFPDSLVACSTATAIMVGFFINNRLVRYVSVSVPVFVSFSRFYAGVAYPRDIAGGVALGFIGVFLMSHGLKFFRSSDAGTKHEDTFSAIAIPIAFTFTAYSLLKIFLPATDGGAGFLGLCGGGFLGHNISQLFLRSGPLSSTVSPPVSPPVSSTAPPAPFPAPIGRAGAIIILFLFCIGLGTVAFWGTKTALEGVFRDVLGLVLGFIITALALVLFNICTNKGGHPCVKK